MDIEQVREYNHTEDKNIERRKELYTAEAKAYYNGNVYVPEDLETNILLKFIKNV